MSLVFPHRFPSRRTSLVVAAVLGAAGVFAAVDSTKSSSAVTIRRDDQPIPSGQYEPLSFSSVVKRVSPSVVKIIMEVRAHHGQSGREGGPDFNDPIFRQFFGNQLPEMRQEPERGLGSGVIISPDGYIVTNNHVVENADYLKVTLSDGREFNARVIGRDPQTDVAVVKVDAKDLPAITFTDSSKVEVGDRVLAVGNPFGVGETVTSGIVSGKERRAPLGLDYEDFIQTDAAINPGNSGGALVDVNGRLIGMNTAILSRSGGSQGVGFAVPSDLVKYVVDSLVQHGKVVRGYLGVVVQDITPALADSFNLKNLSGALISDVQAGRAGAKAGLKSGDVVLSIDGKPVNGANAVSLAVSETAPGTELKLHILRDGASKDLVAVTGTKPNNPGDEDSSALANNDDQGVLNGVTVDDIDQASRSELPATLHGALITDVAPDSAAARAGIQAGDVILEINHHTVSSAKDAVDLSAKATSKKTLVKLWSHGNTLYVVVDESADNDKGSS